MIYNLLVYILVFVLSALLFFAADNTKKVLKYLCICLGIALPCVLAACRDLTVGTDITVYLTQQYRDAEVSNIFTYIQRFSDQPLGFLLTIYISANFFHNIHGCMAIIELIILLCTYKAIYFYSYKKTALPMLFGYFSLFAYSLNIMKQMIAVSIVFLASTYLCKYQYRRYVFFVLLAYTMHQTAIIGFILYPIFKIVQNKNRVTQSGKKLILYTASIIFVFCIYFFQSHFLSILSFIRNSYSYVSQHTEDAKFDRFSFLLLIILIIAYMYSCVTQQNKEHNETLFDYIAYLSFIGYVFREFTLIGMGLERIAFYFQIFSTVYFNILEKRVRARNIFKKIYLIVLLIAFCSTTVNGLNQIYPYRSQILNI